MIQTMDNNFGLVGAGSIIHIQERHTEIDSDIFDSLPRRIQAEKVEVEAIDNVRHKNLVRLLGYYIEDTQRWEIQVWKIYLDCLRRILRLLQLVPELQMEALGGIKYSCDGI